MVGGGGGDLLMRLKECISKMTATVDLRVILCQIQFVAIFHLSSNSLERYSKIRAQPFDDCCLEKLCLWRLWAHNPWKVAARSPSGSPNPYLQSVPRVPQVLY